MPMRMPICEPLRAALHHEASLNATMTVFWFIGMSCIKSPSCGELFR